MKNRYFYIMVGALLLVAGGLLWGMLNQWRTAFSTDLLAAPLAQTVTVAAHRNLALSSLENSSAQIAGSYAGSVSLQFSANGVYSDTITAPSPAEMEDASDMGAIDFALQISQSGVGLSGYVELTNTLIFSTVHTIGQGASALAIGPYLHGTMNGNNFTVESEKVTTVMDGVAIQRQFRLVGSVSITDSNTIQGEYRETLWGYLDNPITVVGNFSLGRESFVEIVAANLNSAPLPAADTISTTPGISVTVAVLQNDIDADGDLLTIASVSKPQFGTASTNGKSVTYQPNAGFEGTDSFIYLVSDDKGNTVGGLIHVQVKTASAPNRVPVAVNDSISTSGNSVVINVVLNDSDPDGDQLTLMIEIAPQHGDAAVQDMQIVYTPDSGFSGSDSLSYRISDGRGGSTVATVAITVVEQPQPSESRIFLPLVNR